MNFSFNAADIPSILSSLGKFIIDNPVLCGVLFVSYGLHFLYQFVNNHASDSEIYEVDLVSSAVSSILVAMMLVGLDETAKGFDIARFDLAKIETQVALGLIVYSLFLVICAFTKMLPRLLVIVFGNSELDVFINFMAVLMTAEAIQISLTTIAVVAVPLVCLLIVNRVRRLMP